MWKIVAGLLFTAFAASTNPAKVILVDCTELFIDSSGSIIIVWGIVKDILVTGSWNRWRSSLTTHFDAASRLRIFECLQNYDILTEAGTDSRQLANKPSCLTRKRFDVCTVAVDAVSLCIIAIFVNGNINFPEALYIRQSRWLTAAHHEQLATPNIHHWRQEKNVTKWHKQSPTFFDIHSLWSLNQVN